MKQILSSIFISILISTTVMAQPTGTEDCRMELRIPSTFETLDYSQGSLRYIHEKNGSAIELQRSPIAQGSSNLKLAAEDLYAQLVQNEELDVAALKPEFIAGTRFYTVTYLDHSYDEHAVMRVMALSKQCGSMYTISLESRPSEFEPMLKAFYEILGTFAPEGFDSSERASR